nr:MAG TPA: hypothetical protein [Caudoviricetes sp.]
MTRTRGIYEKRKKNHYGIIRRQPNSGRTGTTGKDNQTNQLHASEKQRHRNSVQLLIERRSNQ